MSRVLSTFHHHDEHHSNAGREGYFNFIVPHHIPLLTVRAEAQGRNPEAGTKAEAIEEHCFLDCSSWPAQPVFLKHQDYECMGDTGPMGWAFSHQSRKCPTGQPDGGIFSIEASSSKMTLACQVDLKLASTPSMHDAQCLLTSTTLVGKAISAL